ncbi:MAG: hypothetical protein L6R37_000257 [Teloschistes peruensis]|nr:MAG: hypothetical protein L6R37_000257 [Teloschistes peruensis]
MERARSSRPDMTVRLTGSVETCLANIKESKGQKKQKKGKKRDPDEEDSGVEFGMYTNSKPLPGQQDNCEICEKRFTVSPYSGTGPEGGLLCDRCSKEQKAQRKKEEKVKNQGPPSLQDLCIRTIADNVHDIEEFGDLPQHLLKPLSQKFSKRRVITSRTLDLFLRQKQETLVLTDCGKLEVDDYIKIFSFVPTMHTLDLQNAGQFKDEVLDYIMERNVPIRHLKLYAANLISNDKWIEFFTKCRQRLEPLQLSWLDYSMDDNAFMHLVQGCPNLKRLKMKKCWQLGDLALGAIQDLEKLEHLSLQIKDSTSASNLVDMIAAIGGNLRTLSLEDFHNADHSVLETIYKHCSQLQKLRFTENDFCTDTAYTALFTDWSNPPLSFVDFSSNRLVDYDNPDGTEDAVGLGTKAFEALMNHSGPSLKTLLIPSCRHIDREGLANAFDGRKHYSLLRKLDVSFVKKMDTPIIAGVFRSCPARIK